MSVKQIQGRQLLLLQRLCSNALWEAKIACVGQKSTGDAMTSPKMLSAAYGNLGAKVEEKLRASCSGCNVNI